MTTFAKYLQAQMDERGWSRARLARAAGVNRAVITEYMNNGVVPQSGNREKLAAALNVPVSEINSAADDSPTHDVFGLSPARQADAQTLDRSQSELVYEIIRHLAEGNRQRMYREYGTSTQPPQIPYRAEHDREDVTGNDNPAPMNEPDDKVAHLRLEDRPVTRKRTPRWELDEEAANEGDDEIAVDEIPDEST